MSYEIIIDLERAVGVQVLAPVILVEISLAPMVVLDHSGAVEVNVAPSEVTVDAQALGPVVIDGPGEVLVVGTSAVGPPGAPGPQGPPGTAGATVVLTRTAGHTLSGHRIVRPNDDGTVDYADNTVSTDIHRPLWMTTGAVIGGAVATLLAFGEITEPSWSWTPGIAVYLTTAGGLTQTAPTAHGTFLIQLGLPSTPTTLFYDPMLPIAL